MANPQQPELRRSGETPSLTPDAVEGELDARSRPDPKGRTGPVPPANRAGGPPPSGSDPDKPDLDRFAAKLGIDEPDPDGERAAEAARASVQPRDGILGTVSHLVDRTSTVTVGVVGLAAGAAAWLLPKLVRRLRRRG